MKPNRESPWGRLGCVDLRETARRRRFLPREAVAPGPAAPVLALLPARPRAHRGLGFRGFGWNAEGAVALRGRGAAEVKGQRVACRNREDVCHLGDV